MSKKTCKHCGQKLPRIKPVSLNEKEQLYVIPCDGGYSCLGFDVLEKRYCALASELVAQFNYNCPMPAIRGTLERYQQYEKLTELAREQNEKTGWRSKSELTPQLIGFEGKRVEVTHRWENGEVETDRFTVGKSTGFIPCHLMIEGNEDGGPAACFSEIISVRVL